MTERAPIGQVWADKYPAKFHDPDPPQPTACPICDDPTGNCVPEENVHVVEPKKTAKKVKASQPAATLTAPNPGAIPPPKMGPTPAHPVGTPKPRKPVEQDAPVPDGFMVKPESTNLIVATRPVMVKFVTRGQKRSTRVLLFAQGQVTTREGYAERLAMYAKHQTVEVL